MGKPDPDEAELLLNMGSWFHQAGPGSAPPEVLELLRSHVQKRVKLAVDRERNRSK